MCSHYLHRLYIYVKLLTRTRLPMPLLPSNNTLDMYTYGQTSRFPFFSIAFNCACCSLTSPRSHISSKLETFPPRMPCRRRDVCVHVFAVSFPNCMICRNLDGYIDMVSELHIAQQPAGVRS